MAVAQLPSPFSIQLICKLSLGADWIEKTLDLVVSKTSTEDS